MRERELMVASLESFFMGFSHWWLALSLRNRGRKSATVKTVKSVEIPDSELPRQIVTNTFGKKVFL
jgi:hypothetical protein